jgi:hypothetical protein
MKRLPILVFLICSAVYGQSASIAPGLTLGNDRRVADQRITANSQGERFVGLVPQGNDLLAVWIRYPSRIKPISTGSIRSVVVDSNGHPWPETTRVLIEDPQLTAAFADRTATGTLLVWTSDTDTYAARLGDKPRLVAKGQTALGLKCNASRCAVTFYFSVSIIDGDGNVIRDGIKRKYTIAATDPTGFLSVAVFDKTLATQRIDNNGNVSEHNVEAPPGNPYFISVDFDGTRYVVAWTSSEDHAVWAATVSPEGLVSAPFRAFDSDDEVALIAWNGSQHLALLQRTPGCVGFEGTVCPTTLYTRPLVSILPSEQKPLATQSFATLPNFLVANNGTFYVGMTYCSFFGQAGLLVSRLDAHGATTSRDPISLIPQDQRTSQIVSFADHHALFWSETDAVNGTMLAVAANVPANSFGIAPQVLTSLDHDYMESLRAAKVGGDTLVALVPSSSRLQRALIMHSDGSTTAADDPRTGGHTVDVAGSRTAWLVAGADKHASLISRAGINLTPKGITFSSNYVDTVNVASDGTHFLILYSIHGCAFSDCSPSGTYMTLVNPDGSVAFMERKLSDRFLDNIATSWNGRHYLIGTAGYQVPLTLRRVTAEGTIVGDAITLDGPNSYPRIVALRDGWLVIFSKAGEHYEDFEDYAVRIDSDGHRIEAPFEIESTLGIAANDDGTATAIYQQIVAAGVFGSASALFLRDIKWTDVPRRRAITH